MIGLFYDIITFGFDPASLLTSMENVGFFSFYLPFLLLFAIIYAVVSKIPQFKDNVGAVLLISLAASLMALRFGFVADFFSKIFPRFGMGLGLLLIALILITALSKQQDNKVNKWLMGLAVVIFLYVAITSIAGLNNTIEENLEEYGALIAVLVVVGLSIWLIVRDKGGWSTTHT